MVHLHAPFGFPALSDYRFRFRGAKYRVGPSGVRMLELLSEMYDSCRTCDDVTWTLRFRSQLRQVQVLDVHTVLCHVIDRTDDPALRILAIWVRGRCGGTLGTPSIVHFADHDDDQTRKEVARALKRMSAWRPLRMMADREKNPRIQRIATAQPPRPYRLRMAEFSKHVARLEVTPAKRRLVVSPELDVGQGRPPKSPSYIRRILMRIRRMVRGRAETKTKVTE